MRAIWLQNLETKEYWNLLPSNPYKVLDEHGNGACPLLGISGLGYSQNVTQNQVGVDYFISEITSKNTPITGTLLFWHDKHLRLFQEFVGDFRKQLRLFYSPSGAFHIDDHTSNVFYKDVLLTQVGKTEMTQYSTYECAVTFTPQSDVWKSDHTYKIADVANAGTALVYPYVYPYVYGGNETLALNIDNKGRETGCVVRIKNTSANVENEIEWHCVHSYVDSYGETHEDVSKARFYLNLAPGAELLVNSNALTQQAKVTFSDGTGQNVVASQEPSWEYINFIQLEHGENRFIFFLPTTNLSIQVTYTEQREII